MRWLNRQGLHDEEGATAVVVALSLIVLFGFGALVIDVGQIYQERRELQNGADAAVLAAAQDCADPATAATCVPATAPTVDETCWVMTAALESRIDEYANANANDGESSACVADRGADYITVETETLSGGNGYLVHWLAGVIGNPTSTVTARATAKWGIFGGGGTLPLTFSVCEWEDMVTIVDGVPVLPSARQTVYFHKQTDPDVDSCDGPAGQDSPGGFGWLDATECRAFVDADATVDGDPGADPECDSETLEGLVGETVLVPIFSTVTSPPEPLQYTIIGFAGFVIDGYRLGDNALNYPDRASAPCHGGARCISGVFDSYITYGDEIAPPGSNDFGASVVVLTE